MERGWHYDELRQVGTDFADLGEVAAYDAHQGDQESEDEAILDRLAIGPGQIVVDLGTGTGWLPVRAARRGATVHAVDVSSAMLGLARRNADGAGAAAISFHHAGFLTYRHLGPPADAVISKFALHHLPDFWKQAALLNVARFLRPGGRFFLRDVVFSFPPDAYTAGIETWIASVAREDGSGWSRAAFEAHVREEQSTFGWVMEGLIARAGLVLEAADYDGGAYADYLCRKQAE